MFIHDPTGHCSCPCHTNGDKTHCPRCQPRDCGCDCHGNKAGYHCKKCQQNHGRCGLCGSPPPLTDHHTTPREFREHDCYNGKTVKACPECHRRIHKLFTNQELRDSLNTVDNILSDPRWNPTKNLS